jgi:hypothetical protein
MIYQYRFDNNSAANFAVAGAIASGLLKRDDINDKVLLLLEKEISFCESNKMD